VLTDSGPTAKLAVDPVLPKTNTLRVLAVVAIVAASSIVWVVQHTAARARESNQWVVHTQEVLTALETVLASLVDAETAVRAFGDARQATRVISPVDPRTQQVSIDAPRLTIQEMRREENRLLASRSQADQSAVRRLQWVSIVLVVVTVALLCWIVALTARDRGRQRQGTDALLRAKDDLEAQVGANAAALRDSNERLRSIIDSAVDGIIVIDARGRIEAFNRGAERLFGYPESEVMGRNVNMLMPSPDREEHDGYLARYLATGTAKIIGIGRQVTGRRRDGSTFPLHLSVGEMSIKGERKFTGMLHDLSERMRLDVELRASEARWRSVIDSAVDGIVVIDAHGHIESFNPAAERLFGYQERDVMGRNVNILMPSPYHEEHDTYLARHLATGVQKIIGTGREVTGLRRDGTTFPVHLSVGKMTVGGERKFTGILHDLSARVRIEEQLREQASLARLGEMAAVIAHEVKNPLAGVRGAIQVIGTRLPKDGKDAGMIKEIVARIDALNDLMKDLLLFARPPHPKPELVDVAMLVTTTADLLVGDPTLKDVQVSLHGSAPRIVADPDLLKIVFVNLLVNGAHAMQGRGTIRVSVTSIADTCQIAFADEGPGIPAEVLEKIFMPFFTTKSRGSGLGLPTAKRLVEAHHGNITILCPTTGGTIVTVHLPVTATAAAI